MHYPCGVLAASLNLHSGGDRQIYWRECSDLVNAWTGHCESVMGMSCELPEPNQVFICMHIYLALISWNPNVAHMSIAWAIHCHRLTCFTLSHRSHLLQCLIKSSPILQLLTLILHEYSLVHSHASDNTDVRICEHDSRSTLSPNFGYVQSSSSPLPSPVENTMWPVDLFAYLIACASPSLLCVSCVDNAYKKLLFIIHLPNTWIRCVSGLLCCLL